MVQSAGNSWLKKNGTGNRSDTRWACQAKQLSAMAKRIEVVYEVLEEIIDNDTDADPMLSMQNYRWIAILCGIFLLPGIF